VHAACGGSTNLLLHIPAIAHAAGLRRPTVDDWRRSNQQISRFVDVLPNGPVNHPTIHLYLAGGVPEVMWHLREMGAIHGHCMTVSGRTWDEILDSWQASPRRAALRELLRERDGVDPDDVIMPPQIAKSRGLTSTVAFPTGNLCPEGSVIKSTAIDPSVIDADGVFRHTGPAKVFSSERAAIAAIKGQGSKRVEAGDILVLMGCGPSGTGMEETYQLTSALKHIKWGKHVTIVTDARFSGVSTGACIGHVGPEALAGGPIGKVIDGDIIEVIVDRNTLEGSVNLVGEDASLKLQMRPSSAELSSHPQLPDDTRLWAALQQCGGGTWGGCVYDVDAIIAALRRT
jgi:putative YjhG/YagF family dehydratase